jgi:hypothetical protein
VRLKLARNLGPSLLPRAGKRGRAITISYPARHLTSWCAHEVETVAARKFWDVVVYTQIAARSGTEHFTCQLSTPGLMATCIDVHIYPSNGQPMQVTGVPHELICPPFK